MKALPSPYIVIHPLSQGRDAALLDGRELCRSSTPFFAAARQLLAEGRDPSTLLSMRHEGSVTVSMRSTLGTAAGLTVAESYNEGIRVIR